MTHGNLVTLPGYAIQACTYNSSRTQVYRAVSDADQQPVIVKVSGEGHLAANSSSLLRHQYALSQQLAHPGLVDITALIPFKGRYAIVMPDDGSVSLSQYLQQQAKRQQAEGIGSSVALSVTEVLSIGVQIADVLHYLWQQRIIHKDIKPANILIHPQNKQVKLIDFSIASQLPSETQMLIPPDLLEGTLAYIAPEQTGRMNRGIDYRSDFYALGVTLYQLLTGQLPFESEDPLELVHCHLAKQPLSVTALRPDVPEPVAAIVTKLMAKTAEGRYQSATGLQADLETCLHEWKDTGAVSDFVPGRLDNIAQFNIPQRLYGRDQAVKQLLSAFERVCQGGFELVVVKGCSGIGKTALIQELLGCLTEYRGYFSAGKYDQLQRDAPLAVPVKTLRQSVQQLLTEPSERLDYWRDRILNSLGENTRLIINTIPELELIVGPQPEVSQLEGTAAAMRFGETFNRFAQCLSGPDHPYVCFLDDWQWADGASFEMFPHFATDPRNGYYLAGIAYRDNEVSPTHPLMRMLETIRQAGVSITEIHLEPLGCADVARLVADTLHRDPAEVAPLSDVLFQKTEGNPFFLTQMLTSLHGEGLISFEPASKQWQWNLDAIVAEQSPVQVAQELHTTLHTSSSTLAAWLDVETFVKAAKALSSEIMLDRLLEKLLQLMLENAAAQKGCIVLEQAGDWVVEVVDVEMNAQVVEQRGITVAASTEVPQSLIHYVARTGQPQVVADARKAPTLQADPYIQQQQPRSLLVLPMRHQGQTVGIVYLENNLATDAFTPERVEILNLLASQAVIALQNARLYQQSQESQRKMAAVLSSMPGMAYSCLNDEDWTMEYASDGCLNLTGYSPDDLVHNKIIAYAELIHPEDEAMVAEVVGAAVEAYQPYQLTYRITTRDGKEKWVWEQGQALYNEDDEIVVLEGFIADISDRKQSEQALQQSEAQLRQQAQSLEKAMQELQTAQMQMVQSEKMSALGNLVAGVAHEINNPVGFLKGNIKPAQEYVSDLLSLIDLFLQKSPQLDEDIKDEIDSIDLDFIRKDLPDLLGSMSVGVDRIKNISTSLRTFSRADKDHKTEFNLHEGIDSTILILKHRLKASEQRPAIGVVKNYDNSLPKVACFPGQLNQVFMNILANAIDVFDEAAQQTTFAQLKDNPQIITIKTVMLEKSTLEIRIGDNGKGMTAAVQAKIFDHLYTTKGVGKGTGLGLAIARQIIEEKHGGSITVRSQLGKGSEFILKLPI